MAALSQERTQSQLIELDPYAVVANGDPSEFTASSRKKLLQTLGSLADTNPLFRRSDAWRQFNVGTFFTEEIRGDVAALMAPSMRESPLRDLVLDLLSSSRAAGQFAPELRTLAIHAGARRDVRKAALTLLLEDTGYDPRPDLPGLLAENSRDGLELAATAIRLYKSENIETPVVIELLRRLADLYPKSESGRDRNHDSRYFVKMLVGSLDLATAAAALDDLTLGLTCTCNPKHEYQCTCRPGISKIIGMLLDLYLPSGSDLTPERVWNWTKGLLFGNDRSGSDSPSVKFLSENAPLRQAIHRLAVTGLGKDEAKEAVHRLFYSSLHAGIRFHTGDPAALAQYAFETSNIGAWAGLWTRHNFYDEKSRSNPLRTLMRRQANEDPRLMKFWAKFDRYTKRQSDDRPYAFRSRRKRFERREAENVEHNRAHFAANRARIEAGEHWGWLHEFAHRYLFKLDELDSSGYGDAPLLAIRNCIPFLSQHIPTLEELARRDWTNVAEVFFAHCLLRIRSNEPLDDLDPGIIRAAMTEASSYPVIESEEEFNAIEEALHKLVLTSEAAVEAYARAYIEPPLASLEDAATNVEWLQRKKAFHPLLPRLPLEWLEKYPAMPLSAQQSLFEMAAKHGDRSRLSTLIDARFDVPLPPLDPNSIERQIAERRHRFWTLNAFFFETGRRNQALAELRADPKSIISIAELAGRYGRHESDYLPALSAEAIFSVLDAFIDAWPKVPLPSSWGTGDPENEAAYRFLSDVVWRIASDSPSRKLSVLDRLLGDARFNEFRPVLLTLRADAERELALQDFKPPSVEDVASLLDRNKVASVEDLRALMVEELNGVQLDLKGLDTDPLDTFYDGGKHVNENTARNRVVDMVRARLKALGIPVVIEHHMADDKRSDFTATASVSGANPMLVVEAKGQWHAELFTAAAAQLSARYSIHPDASGQGIYLVFWFGNGETIAGKAVASITSASELREAILEKMPAELKRAIDVVVLDVSRPSPEPTPDKAGGSKKPAGKARAAPKPASAKKSARAPRAKRGTANPADLIAATTLPP